MFIDLALFLSLCKVPLPVFCPLRGQNPQLMTLGVKIRTLKSWMISGKKTVSQQTKLKERRKATEPQNWEPSVWEAALASHRHGWDMWVMLRVPKGLAWWSYRRLSLGRGWQAPSWV